jgi:AcrR family transcriptional regulator
VTRPLKKVSLEALDGLFARAATRAERRKLEIVEGAIRSYAKQGIDGTTFDTIAKEAKTSRPLVLHHFKTKEEIFTLSIKFIRLNYQNYVDAQLEKETDAVARFKVYVSQSLRWRAEFSQHAQVWVLFWFQCTYDKKARALNTLLQNIGDERIRALLQDGIEAKAFSVKKLEETARLIQVLINGGLVLSGTQDWPQRGPSIEEITLQHCLRLAQGKLGK